MKKSSLKMKIPGLFRPERERLEKEVEEIVKNTIVDKVLVKDLAKELEKYFESKDLAEKIELSFEKKFDLPNNPDLNTQSVERCSRVFHLREDAKKSLKRRSIDSVLYRLRELKPDIREEEITNDYGNAFSIITEEAAYNFALHDTERYNDQTIVAKEINVKGYFRNKIKIIEEIYQNVVIQGKVTYAKFDKSHHETLLKILKEEGYSVSVGIKEKK